LLAFGALRNEFSLDFLVPFLSRKKNREKYMNFRGTGSISQLKISYASAYVNYRRHFQLAY